MFVACSTSMHRRVPGLSIILCVVNGAPVALSQIADEHEALMTPEEYTAYYEVLTAQAM